MDKFPRLNRGFHTPVLLEEAIEGLNVKSDGKYIDATIGGGGHTQEILGRGGAVLGIDQDEDSILYLKKKFESELNTGQLVLERGNFAEIKKIAGKHKMNEVDGILFDLGVSSYQIDQSGRGFSFLRDEHLEMRMSNETKLTAEEIINTWPEKELSTVFAKYGEDPNAAEVAHQIIFRRKQKKFERSADLAEFISGIVITEGKIHPATRIFQALRIVVNDEIDNLRTGIAEGFKLLAPGGRMEVISFHSLEDRVVKLYFVELRKNGFGKIITKKPTVAAFDEIKKNRRSRSAKMRIIEKI